MHNCIFTSHCTEMCCDQSCPTLVETSYLLERNNISLSSFVFSDRSSYVSKAIRILEACKDAVGAYVVERSNKTTVQWAEMLTYCAICQNWQGSRLHCNVYNLRYSKYLEELKKSWNTKSESDDLEYMRIWSETAKVLIISNFDYVTFGDFECQTLLTLLQSRQSEGFTTVLVTPPINSIVGSKWSQFLEPLRRKLREAAKVVSEVVR